MKKVLAYFCSVLAVGGFILTSTTPPVHAQDYPEQAITFIVPWPAGGRTDIVGRMVASSMGSMLGQPVAVVNQVGGGGAVGTLAVLDAPADGYTVLVTTIGNQVLQPLARDTGYGPEDFIAIGQIASDTMVVATAANRPWQDAEELLDAAREAPDTITYGAVPDVLPDRAMRSFADAAGVEFAHIPTQGDAEGVPMAAGGHIDLVVSSSLGALVSQLEAGEMRALVIFDAEPHPDLPDVPTASDLGYNVVASPWTGLAVAPDTPDEVVEVLRDALREVVQDEAFQNFANNAGITVSYLDGEEFARVWSDNVATFGGR